MNFNERIPKPRGSLEIIVMNHYTGEIISHDDDHNQLQDWTKQSYAYLNAGIQFCTWGNHGEQITDTGNAYSINHYEDGSSTNKLTATPWTYTPAYAGMVQQRDGISGNIQDANIVTGTPLFPFFPTKMRFGTGGLTASLQPRDDIGVDATKLNNADNSCPFIVIDRLQTTQHISLSQTSANTIDKVTFSVKLPGGLSAYPYNGKVISEAGLFCDAALSVGQDTNMRTGMMLAYRTFKGLPKDESIDIIFNWSWQF
jgi:hypothetical protein